MELRKLLELLVEKKGSDLHLRADSLPYVRITGKLSPISDAVLKSEETKNIAVGLMSKEQQEVFYKKHECDMAITFPELGRFRLNIYQQKNGINIAIRHVPVKVPSIEELGLPSVITKMAENARGLLLVTGPTGCGKSTTLGAIINHINSTRSCHIVTIEDPIEYVHEDKKAIVSQRELGIDTLSYHDALRQVVRQNPDVILIGEMRDLETMSAALTAAQLGHFVLSTIHTIDTIQTVSRIVDMFPPYHQDQIRYQLADTLKGVIAQRLLPRKDESKGMIPAVEILIVTALVKKHIESNNLNEISNLIRQGQYYGMQGFNQALINLYREGKITLEVALQAATSPEELMLAIRGVETSTESSAQVIERFSQSKDKT